MSLKRLPGTKTASIDDDPLPCQTLYALISSLQLKGDVEKGGFDVAASRSLEFAIEYSLERIMDALRLEGEIFLSHLHDVDFEAVGRRFPCVRVKYQRLVALLYELCARIVLSNPRILGLDHELVEACVRFRRVRMS